MQIDYSYDKAGRILTIKGKCDTLYRNAVFHYQGDKLVRVDVECNTMTKFSEVFWIYSRYHHSKAPKFLFTKELFYGGKGALVKTLDKIDGVQDNIVHYLYKYYYLISSGLS